MRFKVSCPPHRVIDGGFQGTRIHAALWHVAQRTAPERRRRDLFVALSRQNDDRQGGPVLMDLVHEVEAVLAVQPVIDHHAVDRGLADLLECAL